MARKAIKRRVEQEAAHEIQVDAVLREGAHAPQPNAGFAITLRA